jgi:F-type H+-transporting ATPase subunit alpha
MAGGDWSDETQTRLKDLVAEFADDFGYDLDEEGTPVDEKDDVDDRSRGRSDEDADDGSDDDATERQGEAARGRSEEPAATAAG